MIFAFQGGAILQQPLVIAMPTVPILIQMLLNRKVGEQHSARLPP